jgi:hypothetical protein
MMARPWLAVVATAALLAAPFSCAANVGVPGKIPGSIEDTLEAQ